MTETSSSCLKTKLLGVVFTDDLKWQAHIDAIVSGAPQRLYLLTRLRRAGVDQTSLVDIHVSLVRSVAEYACQVWHPVLTGEQTKKLESIQHRAMNIIFSGTHYDDALRAAGLNKPEV